MAHAELAHLELLAEMDRLDQQLARWVQDAPDWPAAQTCRALVGRLQERTRLLRLRVDRPLVVATLGGTGTGKSSLVNAIAGEEISPAGQIRPTTERPILVSRSDLSPETLGIDPEAVQWCRCDRPSMQDLVLIDCPDPDTTEQTETPGTNLARLRRVLPHCDVILITTTQQKYRSACVARELEAAAAGARLVFVQTHADTDEDIRPHWQQILEQTYTPGHIFLVDCRQALEEVRSGQPPSGEFGRLLDLLTRQLGRSAAVRIRRANYLDLVDATLEACARRIDENLPPVKRLQEAIVEQRRCLAAQLAERIEQELLASRRDWENRLLGRVLSHWGFSPFSLVLRVFHTLGALITGSLLLRARSPIQLALVGILQGTQHWRKARQQRRSQQNLDQAATQCWNENQLQRSALLLRGYVRDARMDPGALDPQTLGAETDRAGRAFLARLADQLEEILDWGARKHAGWFTRWRYEMMFLAVAGLLVARLAKNFFYDSWLADPPHEVYGLEIYLLSILWLLLWAGVLLWAFTGRLRRGLSRRIQQMAQQWKSPQCAEGVFAALEANCRQVEQFRSHLTQLRTDVEVLRRQLAGAADQLGRRRERTGSSQSGP